MHTDTARQEAGIVARLAVIESKLETILTELTAIRECVPAKIVEHTDRINTIERDLRGLQWVAGVFAVAIVGAVIGHILGR